MIPQPTIVGICLGIIFIIIYVIICLFAKQNPEFGDAVKILTSWVGLIISLDFGLVAFLASPQYLGPLTEHRVPMVLGAMAVIWEAIRLFGKVYHPLISAIISPVQIKPEPKA